MDTSIGAVEATTENTSVRVEDLGLAFGPTVIEATHADGSTTRRIIPAEHWLAGNTRAFVDFGPDVEKVVIDPDARTLDVNRKNNIWKRGTMR